MMATQKLYVLVHIFGSYLSYINDNSISIGSESMESYED